MTEDHEVAGSNPAGPIMVDDSRPEYGPYWLREVRETLDDPLDSSHGSFLSLQSHGAFSTKELCYERKSTLLNTYLSAGFARAAGRHGPFYDLVALDADNRAIAVRFDIEPQSEKDHLVACVREASAIFRNKHSAGNSAGTSLADKL